MRTDTRRLTGHAVAQCEFGGVRAGVLIARRPLWPIGPPGTPVAGCGYWTMRREPGGPIGRPPLRWADPRARRGHAEPHRHGEDC